MPLHRMFRQACPGFREARHRRTRPGYRGVQAEEHQGGWHLDSGLGWRRAGWDGWVAGWMGGGLVGWLPRGLVVGGACKCPCCASGCASARASAHAGKRAGSQVLSELARCVPVVRASGACRVRVRVGSVRARACRETTGPDPHGVKRHPLGTGGVDGRSLWTEVWTGAYLCGRAEEGGLAGPLKYAPVRPTGLLCT